LINIAPVWYDRDALTVECNHTSIGCQVAGEKLGASHGTTNGIMQIATSGVRERIAARSALHMRFTEEGYSDVVHGSDSLLRLPLTAVAGGGRPAAAVSNKLCRTLLINRKSLITYMRKYCDSQKFTKSG
tara:strand:- start:1079 stop:1468 length:390 start_codon:yes stop_codon:yes gene_type:complete